MTRVALVAMALMVGCGSDPVDPVTDPDLHRVVTCSASWEPLEPETTGCEAPCTTPPAVYMPQSGSVGCTGAYPWPGQPDTLVPAVCFDSEIFEVDGNRGCCTQFDEAQGKVSIHFAVCVD